MPACRKVQAQVLISSTSTQTHSSIYKNVNDILTAAPTLGHLEETMEAVLKVCLKRNMKLSPFKFQCACQVTFGGVTIESLKQRDDDERRVYLLKLFFQTHFLHFRDFL